MRKCHADSRPLLTCQLSDTNIEKRVKLRHKTARPDSGRQWLIGH
jgi:hypothetical protein